DGLIALEHQGDERRAGDEVDELAEERPLLVLVVVDLREIARSRHVLESDDLQPLALEAGDDLAGQAARERVRLDQDEGLFHRRATLRIGLGDRRLLGAPPAAAWRRRLARDLRLAVGAALPVGIQRLRAVAERILQLAE